MALACWLAAAVWLAGCGTNTEDPGAQAYVAPAAVNLRSQLNQKESTVEVLSHGEQVSVIDARRRFVKIRTPKGTEGWLDSNDLLSPAEMQRIRNERAQAARLPSEGRATAYEALNIHLDPSRKSPAFAKIQEGGPVSVLARKVVVKDMAPNRPPFVFERPKPPDRRQGKGKRARPSLKPPLPPAPKPPANWQHFWGGEEPETAEQAPAPLTKSQPALAAKPKPPVLEDWLLVRTEHNQIGWALARNLMMSIPDDVAQYAGGARITSYFDLGAVNDERDGEKHNWLWTTASTGELADFDAWRVFLWNRRRHRFETSYRQRDLEGFFPVTVDLHNSSGPGRTFKLITRDDDGRRRRRTYLFDGVRVHLVGTEEYREPQSLEAAAASARAAHDEGTGNWLRRQWSLWKQRFGSTQNQSAPPR